MPDLEFIKTKSLRKGEVMQEIDMRKVDSIVSRLKDKYSKEGTLDKVESENLGELRSIIAEGKRGKIEVLKPQDLRIDFNPMIRKIGAIYVTFSGFFKLIAQKLYKIMPHRDKLAYELYSANINYSTMQYLAIASVISTLISILFSGILFSLFYLFDLSLGYAGGLSAVFFLFLSGIIIYYPTIVSNRRSKEIDRQLPFALRHMATQLRSGVGLYRVMQSVAVADYGIFSEELARTISEIEEGSSTNDALKNLALRTKSYALKNTINHLLRALKSGGNLSSIMNSIADEVSFELRIEIESFSEKMNFFGVIYIFIGIVMPVMVAVLSGIRNAPLGQGVSMFNALPLTPLIISIFFMILLPLVMFVLVTYVKSIRPTF